MLSLLRLITGTAVAALALVMVARASAQEPDSNATCYLRIEGHSTQDVSRLCGKNARKSRTPDVRIPATRNSATVGLDQPSTAIDADADEDQPLATDESATIPAPASSPQIPSPATIPLTQPAAAPAAPARSPSILPPTQLAPNATPNPVPDVLPVPRPPATRQPVRSQPRTTSTSNRTSRTQPPSQSPAAHQPQTAALKAPSFIPSRRSLPPAPHVTPPAQPSPQTTVLDPQAPRPQPQTSLLEALLQQKYFYLFWLVSLQVPLLKVAIDRRSRSTVQKQKARTQRLAIVQKPKQEKRASALMRSGSEQGNIEQNQHDRNHPTVTVTTVAPQTEPLPQENISRAAEFDLSQADNQIAQIKVILASAVRNRVSDIHLEPTTEGLRVRYRIDGILRDVTMLPLEVSRRTIVALKVMAEMDIAESRRPQDARISEQYASTTDTNLDLDLRVSTLPCIGGEKAVIRLLPRQNPFSEMDELGFAESALALYKGWLKQPQGMIIFTGPTGSGKTSTLYTSLQSIATEHVNVVTVEDPVEYILPCITQTQVNETAGMTFAAGLRAILRQDPDIIMVGEIRDGETAETAVRAALTGHLVLTTLHTNDAVGAIPRLKDVGPDPGLISDALLGVIAQRLVRRVCPHCAAPYTPTVADLHTLGLTLKTANAGAWRQGKGCHQCFHSGYLGREAIIELVNVDARIRQIIYEGSSSELTDYLNEINFDSFRKTAIAKVTTGITTIAEIRRVLPASKLTIDA